MRSWYRGAKVLRKQRRKNEVPVVSLVGYTNAGKSSLMNAMLEVYHPDTDKQVFAHNMLFATLETKSRSIELPGNRSFVLTDTVGFVSQLPHHLVKAFRSTLEEVAEADLLLHVVDRSNPDWEVQMEVTRETLRDLGADHVKELIVYNKSDLTDEPYPRLTKNSIYLSAREKRGIDELSAELTKRIFQDFVQCEILVPYDKGRWYPTLILMQMFRLQPMKRMEQGLPCPAGSPILIATAMIFRYWKTPGHFKRTLKETSPGGTGFFIKKTPCKKKRAFGPASPVSRIIQDLRCSLN